jgi:hypothetical protein
MVLHLHQIAPRPSCGLQSFRNVPSLNYGLHSHQNVLGHHVPFETLTMT